MDVDCGRTIHTYGHNHWDYLKLNEDLTEPPNVFQCAITNFSASRKQGVMLCASHSRFWKFTVIGGWLSGGGIIIYLYEQYFEIMHISSQFQLIEYFTLFACAREDNRWTWTRTWMTDGVRCFCLLSDNAIAFLSDTSVTRNSFGKIACFQIRAMTPTKNTFVPKTLSAFFHSLWFRFVHFFFTTYL